MKEVNSVSDATNTYGEDIKLTTTDASTLYKTIITELEKGAGEPLYPGDERRIFGEALVPVFVALYNSLNDVGRQTLLRYARGEVLDAIGERNDWKAHRPRRPCASPSPRRRRKTSSFRSGRR